MPSSTFTDAAATLARRRILPVATAHDERELHALSDALVGGGLPVIELTLRTPYALQGVRDATGRGDLLVGAGSIRSIDDARAAVEAGAAFLVSPGFDASVAEWTLSQGVDFFPGVATPSEVLAARALGITTVKLFPAALFGGPAWVTAVGAPIPDMAFIPTGGIDGTTFEGYLRTPGVLAVGGSWFLSGGAKSVADVVDRASAVARTVSGS